MNETIISIGEDQYSIDKMDAMRQWHVTRKLLPILITAVGGLKDYIADGSLDFDAIQKRIPMQELILKIAEPLCEEIAKRSDEEIDKIVFPCLEVVKRKQGPVWAAVKVKGQNALMFADMEAGTILRLTVEVLKVNLAGFFGSGRPKDSESPPPSKQ